MSSLVEAIRSGDSEVLRSRTARLRERFEEVVPPRVRHFALGVVTMLVTLYGFYLYDAFIFAGSRLPSDVHQHRSIVWTALERSEVRELFLVTVPVVLFRWRQTSWEAIGDKHLRVFITVPTVLLAFAFSAYDFNHYFDQLHLPDRLLVISLGIATWVHPGFAAPTTIVTILIARQFSAPLNQYTWTDKRLLFDVLLLFHVYLCLHAFKKHKPFAFYSLALVLIGGSYIIPAFTKLELGWHQQDELWNLFIGAYTNDWYATLSPETAVKIAQAIKKLTPLLLAGTLVFELIPFIFLLHRRLSMAILLGCAALHCGIFLASGIFFWKWITLDLVLVYVFRRMNREDAKLLFGPKNAYLWLSIPMMYFVRDYASVVRLGWLDTELNTTYHFEAVGESGQVYPVSRSFFSPFDVIFSQNRFPYLSRERNIPMTFGVHTNEDIGQAVNQARTAEDIEALERRYGQVTYHAAQARRFDRFIRRYFQSVNAHGEKKEAFYGWFGAPHHIWNFRHPGDYWGQEPVTEVRVRMKKQFFRDDAHLDTLFDEVVRTIAITPKSPQRKSGSARPASRPKPRATPRPRATVTSTATPVPSATVTAPASRVP